MAGILLMSFLGSADPGASGSGPGAAVTLRPPAGVNRRARQVPGAYPGGGTAGARYRPNPITWIVWDVVEVLILA